MSDSLNCSYRRLPRGSWELNLCLLEEQTVFINMNHFPDPMFRTFNGSILLLGDMGVVLSPKTQR